MCRGASRLVVISSGAEKNDANRNHDKDAYHVNGNNLLFLASNKFSTLITQNNNINTKYTNTLAKLWHQNEYRWNMCKKNQQTHGMPSLLATAIPHRLDLTHQRYHHIGLTISTYGDFFSNKKNTMTLPVDVCARSYQKHCSSTIMLPVKLLLRKLPQTAVAGEWRAQTSFTDTVGIFMVIGLFDDKMHNDTFEFCSFDYCHIHFSCSNKCTPN